MLNIGVLHVLPVLLNCVQFSTSAQPQKAALFIFIQYRSQCKMEGGYTTIDEGALSLKSGQKLFLIKLPKDFNIEELNGKTIDVSGNVTSKATEIETANKRKYVLKKDQTSVHSIVRPIISNDLDGSTSVGPAFSGTFNLAEKIDIKLVPSADRYNALPIRPAYVDVKQVDFLQVRTVPMGSTSHVDACGAIIPGKTVGSSTPAVTSTPAKKAKHTHNEEAPVEEEKSSKKHKKEKKSKDSKKDKSS